MNTPLAVESAVYTDQTTGLIKITFNDGSVFCIYQSDGSPRNYAHDLLDEWIAAGNLVANQPE